MTHDKQFSIEQPIGDGWPTPADGSKSHIMIDIFGGGEYFIDVADETIKFEWSERFGPMALTKKGAERALTPKHKFWRAASLWNLQGQRLEGSKAIWHEPKKPVLQHLGGRNFMVIEDGEKGYDW